MSENDKPKDESEKENQQAGADSDRGVEGKGDEAAKKDAVVPPPISPVELPKPDDFDLSKSKAAAAADARERAKAEKEARKKRNKKRSHPTDSYAPLKREGKGLWGCFFLTLLVVTLVLVGVGIYFSWWAVGVYKNAGYDVVQIERLETAESIVEAPEKETVFVSKGKLDYLVETTPKPIVIVGPEVLLSGRFEDKVVFKGGKITLEEGTVFEGDFEVYAVEMIDKGAVINGELQGSVMQQTK